MRKRIKLGIIGTGIAARKLHLPALKKLEDFFEITAVCNHTSAKAEQFSSMVGDVPYFLSYHELLDKDYVDAVDITLPIDLNYEVTLAALNAGKHVFLEKPIAANLTQAAEMLKFSQRYDRIMLLAENFRYRKVYIRLKEIIASGKIGKPYAAQWNVFYGVTIDSEYAATKWRQNHKYPGGFITDAGVHNIAALRLLFGEVISVASLSNSVNPSIGKPDTMTMLLKFDSSVQVVFNLFFSSKNYSENKFLIFGDKDTVEVKENEIRLSGSLIENCDDDGGYYAEFMDFYNAVVNNTLVKSDFHQGQKDLQVVMNALGITE